ncbi:myosin-10 isoform X1 [Pyrus x bretschneideri]|uniref:myosin-10 isoform X1 n=1 Tax=Pyrus x bretschneideri TaxID=225117 RepID=UPI00202F6B11|nr:myosin-10 isoform X1 [Pyrus x bretschneideri]
MSAVGESEVSSKPTPVKPNVAAATTPPQASQCTRQFITSVASKIASQPLQNYDPGVWGVLTAISTQARKRNQGINILLTADEHWIGRTVDDVRFQIDSNAVSGRHCKIYRKRAANEDTKHTSVCLKDMSTNGTYLNWMKLTKVGVEAEVHHGDIISPSAPPQHDLACAFVYRDVSLSSPSTDGAFAKRKAEDFVTDNKRVKGIGIGSSDGPISLDDFRSLQRSNTELRKQLENQVVTIDTLRNETRLAVECHENEKKELRESVARPYLDQLSELQCGLEIKQKELAEANRIYAETKHAIEDLNERLSASVQSCSEANEIVNSQKASIAELKAQLDEERAQRREEREKAAADLKAAVQKAQSEAEEDLKRFSDDATRRQREQQEVINKLQESEKETCLLVETLRTKLEDTRQKLVVSDYKVRQLETQLSEEQSTSESRKIRVEELEHEMRGLRKELESEKQAAREEAWAKVSALELEINAAMRDLDFERRRLKAARERIMLRETQLRAFYSTTEEISVLFTKQQEQLKSMQKTLEDEENYDNTSADIDLNVVIDDVTAPEGRGNEAIRYHSNITAKAGSATTSQRSFRNQIVTSSDEVSVTEKHDCDIRSQEGQHTEEAEFTSADLGVKGAFGSEIDGVGTAPIMEGDGIDTEHVPETESPGINGEQNIDLNRIVTLEGDTMQLDDEANVQENDEQVPMICQERHSQSNSPHDTLKGMEDTEACGTIRTADLLASEVIGSWAYSTAPSVHGDNGSQRSRDNNEEGAAAPHNSTDQVAESQSTPSSDAAARRRNLECQAPNSSSPRFQISKHALSEMIGIVAPDLKEQFGGIVDDSCDHAKEKQGSASDSDTESCSDNEEDNRTDAKSGSISDSETEGSERGDEDKKSGDAMDEDDQDTEDSLR